jgi:hypothetical protein
MLSGFLILISIGYSFISNIYSFGFAFLKAEGMNFLLIVSS